MKKKYDNKKLKRWILPLSIILVLLSFILFSNYGLIKRINLESRKKELRELISKEKKAEDSLKRYIYRLETDTLEIERIAREKYGMIKPGEKVYIFKQKNKD